MLVAAAAVIADIDDECARGNMIPKAIGQVETGCVVTGNCGRNSSQATWIPLFGQGRAVA